MCALQTAFEFPSAALGATSGCTDHRVEPPSGGQSAGDPLEEALSRLARGLRERMDAPLALTLTDNGRVMVSAREEPGGVAVRLHHMFLHADADTLDALAGYLGGDRHSGNALSEFVERNRNTIRRRPKRGGPLRPLGRHHNLDGIRMGVSEAYFAGECDPRITWGRRSSVKLGRRSSIKLGSYRPSSQLIRIHPALDASWVPSFFVEYVVYHEMLHHVLGATVQGSRRYYHTPHFRALERQFARYDEAIAWEQRNLRRLLRS